MTEETNEKTIVRIDADLEDLIPGFLKGREKDIETINTCLEASDYEKIFMIGHSMKGNGAGYGFDEITNIGHVVEDAAKSENEDKIRKAVADLGDYLKSVEVVYESP